MYEGIKIKPYSHGYYEIRGEVSGEEAVEEVFNELEYLIDDLIKTHNNELLEERKYLVPVLSVEIYYSLEKK